MIAKNKAIYPTWYYTSYKVYFYNWFW